MANNDSQMQRLGIITALVKSQSGLGRTAVMKCLYFLKILKQVPLPYRFRLYTYGPFDSDVLEDLQYAEYLGAIVSENNSYSGGFGYRYEVGPNAKTIEQQAQSFLDSQKDNVTWVINEFGMRTAQDLEMISTLIFVDRSHDELKESVSIDDLAKKVHNVKPHLSIHAIQKGVEELNKVGYLNAIN